MTASAAIVLAMALPLLAFGPDHALKLFGSWINELLYTASPAGGAAAHCRCRRPLPRCLAPIPAAPPP